MAKMKYVFRSRLQVEADHLREDVLEMFKPLIKSDLNSCRVESEGQTEEPDNSWLIFDKANQIWLMKQGQLWNLTKYIT